MQHIIDNHPDMATALLAGEKLKELILPGQQDDKAGALAALLLQLKLELPFDRVVTIGTVLIPILLVTLVFTKNFAGKGCGLQQRPQKWPRWLPALWPAPGGRGSGSRGAAGCPKDSGAEGGERVAPCRWPMYRSASFCFVTRSQRGIKMRHGLSVGPDVGSGVCSTGV